MTMKQPGNTHANARSGSGMEDIISRIARNNRQFFLKPYEKVSLGRAGD